MNKMSAKYVLILRFCAFLDLDYVNVNVLVSNYLSV
jgi:hypothetical protein